MANDTEVSVIPRHVGYIVDGNRRWAKKHGLPVYEGHLAGYNALKEVAISTLDSGVEFMSAYVFSTENWKRTNDEVKKLLKLVMRLVTSDLHEFQERNVRLKILGMSEGLTPKMINDLENAMEVTKDNTGGEFLLCFNYGGHREIADAVKKIVASGVEVEAINEELIAENLYAPEVPPVDLIVRTGGEQRLSNFMLWRSAYSEFIFLDKSWPDMTKDDVKSIINEYAKRQRRFGG